MKFNLAPWSPSRSGINRSSPQSRSTRRGPAWQRLKPHHANHFTKLTLVILSGELRAMKVSLRRVRGGFQLWTAVQVQPLSIRPEDLRSDRALSELVARINHLIRMENPTLWNLVGPSAVLDRLLHRLNPRAACLLTHCERCEGRTWDAGLEASRPYIARPAPPSEATVVMES